MSLIMTAADMPLGLNFIEIALHIFNFIILIVAVRFLLYKPIKKFMDKRAEGYKKEEAEYLQKKEEADRLNEEARAKVAEAEENARRIEEEASENATQAADGIIASAKQEADEYKAKAEADMAAREALEREALSKEVADLAVTMSSKILEREVSADDNEAVIAPLIAEFKNVHKGDKPAPDGDK